MRRVALGVQYGTVLGMKPSVLLVILALAAATAFTANIFFRPGACGGGIPEELPTEEPTSANPSAL